MKSYKVFTVIILILIYLSIMVFAAYAGNNDSLPIYGYIGQGATTGWEYTRHHSGMQI